MSSDTVFISILDKEYQIACPPEDREDLMESARLLDARMRDVRKNSNIVGLDRIAVMAALNICHELIQTRQQGGQSQAKDLERLSAKVKQALAEFRDE